MHMCTRRRQNGRGGTLRARVDELQGGPRAAPGTANKGGSALLFARTRGARTARRPPNKPSSVVIQRELPRMRPHPARVDLFLSLVADLRLDQPRREHVALAKERVVRLQRIERRLQLAPDPVQP